MWTEMGRQAFQLPVSSWSHQTSPNTFDAGLHMQNIHHSRHWQISRIPRKLKGSQANPTTLVMKAAVYCKHGAQQLATWNNITNINIHKREKNPTLRYPKFYANSSTSNTAPCFTAKHSCQGFQHKNNAYMLDD